MGRAAKIISVFSVLAAGAAVVAGVWVLGEKRVAYLTDGRTIEARADEIEARDILWSPPEEVPLGVDGFAHAVSSRGGEVVFSRGTPGDNAELWVALREGDGWGDARLLSAVNSGYDELDPSWLPGGAGIVFASDRPGGAGGYDLWIAERRGGEWSAPVWLGPTVNGPLHEFGPFVSADGTSVWFASNRPTASDGIELDGSGAPVRVRAEMFDRQSDLYRAPFDGDRAGTPERVTELSSDGSEAGPALSPAGDFVYFSSDRGDGFDLYRVRVLDDGFGEVESIGAPVNTDQSELDASVVSGGFELWYSTASDGVLRRSVSKEVYRRMVAQRAEIDWLGWLRDHWMTLLSLALLLSLLAIILLLLRDTKARSRWATLSLMARCVLASVFLHLILAALFTAWQVKTSLEGLLDGGGPTRVAMVSSAGQSSIAGQLRGAATAVSVSPAAASSLSSAAAVAPAAVEYQQTTQVAAGANAPEMTIARAESAPARGVQSDAQRIDVGGEAPALPGAEVPDAARPETPSLDARNESESALAWAPVAPAATDGGAPTSGLMTIGVPSERETELVQTDAPGEAALQGLDVRAELSELNESADGSVEIAMEFDDEFGSLSAAESPDVATPGPVAEPDSAAERSVEFAATDAMELAGLETDLLDAVDAPTDAPDPGDTRLAEADLMETSMDLSDLGGADLGFEELEMAAIDVGDLGELSMVTPDLDLPEAFDPRPYVRGVVVNDDTDQPIVGSLVRLDRSGEGPLETLTDERGRFTLSPDELPDFFAVSATFEGFTPGAADMSAGAVEAGGTIEIRLSPESFAVIAMESDPRVRHLGNDEFNGRVNSQFQRESEGTSYRATFTLDGERSVGGVRAASVLLLLKGAQVGNPVFINGRQLEATLIDSPADGSYREERLPVPVSLLRDGLNTLEIRSVRAPGTDIDDFEFVNVRVELELGADDGSVSL